VAAGPVLELGCGTGRLTRPLASLGFDVVGIDNDPALLEWSAPRVTLVEADMRDFDLSARFALVTIPYNSLQLLPDEADQRRCFEAINHHLDPGGLLGLEVTDFLVTATAPVAPTEPLASAEGVTLYGALDASPPDRMTWYQRRYVFDDGTPDVRDTVALRDVDEHDLETLAAGVGFDVVEAERTGRRLSWVAQKPSGSVADR
jgi:SAM-dependent methyltransferase